MKTQAKRLDAIEGQTTGDFGAWLADVLREMDGKPPARKWYNAPRIPPEIQAAIDAAIARMEAADAPSAGSEE
jgi:hypothetical protein